MTIVAFLLGTAATGIGLWYAVLGISAVQHLAHADHSDKAVGWSLWWCLDVDRYDSEGRRLCKKGQLLASVAITLWIAVVVIHS
jgi:hypothetical protein